jgi:hypothetical protein
MRAEKRPYYLRRKGEVWYASLLDPVTGKHLPWLSTGETKEANALMVVAGWMKDGTPKTLTPCDRIIGLIRGTDLTSQEARSIVLELKGKGFEEIALLMPQECRKILHRELIFFWSEGSPYIKGEVVHGHTIGKKYYELMQSRVRNYWAVHPIGHKDIREVPRQDLQDFGIFLKETSGLVTTAINGTMLAGTIAFGVSVKFSPVFMRDHLEHAGTLQQRRGSRGGSWPHSR